MYLAEFTIEGFRKLNSLTLKFAPGLNILVGPNNSGKTAIIDALRSLLATNDDGVVRLMDYDLHTTAVSEKAAEVKFQFVFRELSGEEEADFLMALRPRSGSLKVPPEYEAHISVRYSTADAGGRLRVKRWCGEHEDNPVTSEMLEDLRAVYLPPLRDPAQGLRPSRSSQLACLVQRLSSEDSRQEVEDLLKRLDEDLRIREPISRTQAAVADRHSKKLGELLCQVLSVGLSPSDFQRIAARLSLSVDALDVEQNGLGYNNLIYMAVVLSELSLNPDAAYKALIVEEPESHLHPQLQAVLLQYLQSVEKPQAGERAVQVFVTSHSPNFASIADIDTIACIYPGSSSIKAFFPRDVVFEKRKKEKLQRYLDVTRAELFFARRIILVEGAAELFLMKVLAKRLSINLRQHSVSVISTEGLNFDAFLPLFGENSLNIPVAVLTDSDTPAYPGLGDVLDLSYTAKSIAAREDSFVKVFFALKTFEYDLALYSSNREAMLQALSEIHPQIAGELSEAVGVAAENEKARVLFSGMFERGDSKSNVQKGAFGQALAQVLEDGWPVFEVPGYIAKALQFIVDAKV